MSLAAVAIDMCSLRQQLNAEVSCAARLTLSNALDVMPRQVLPLSGELAVVRVCIAYVVQKGMPKSAIAGWVDIGDLNGADRRRTSRLRNLR